MYTHKNTERESERDVCIYIYHAKIIFTNNIYNFSTKFKKNFKGLNHSISFFVTALNTTQWII